MLSNWQWRIMQFTKRVWFRSTMYSLLGVATALIALLLSPYLPDELPAKIGADAVDNILTIMASSMLAVTTFSLSTLVAAYGTATSNVTPRAVTLLVEDPTSQNVLSTFLGGFLFSLVGIIALSTGLYGEKGRLILFVMTLLVIAVIVFTLLRWIDYLSRFGRVGETTQRVEAATTKSMRERKKRPYLGGVPDPDTGGEGAKPTHLDRIGYVQHVDMGLLQDWAEARDLRLRLGVLPGTFVDPSRPAAWVLGMRDTVPDDDLRGLHEAFTIGDARSFDQDPRFGMSVLAEIASRALSPAVNDPGTAIDVIGRAVRLLLLWAAPGDDEEPEFPRVLVSPITVDELFDDVFRPIARDGAGIAEVQVRLQKAYDALSKSGDPRFRSAAERHAREALARAQHGLTLAGDLDRVRRAAVEGSGA